MPDKLQDYARQALAELRQELLQSLPARKRLKGLSAAEIRKGLSPEERLKGLSVEEIIRALPPETLKEMAQQLENEGKCLKK